MALEGVGTGNHSDAPVGELRAFEWFNDGTHQTGHGIRCMTCYAAGRVKRFGVVDLSPDGAVPVRHDQDATDRNLHD